jgi:hypothetical protein
MRMSKRGWPVLLLILASGCGGAVSPTTPSVSSVAVVPPSAPAATLAISTFTVTRSAVSPVHYDVKLLLTETGGRSGATLTSVGLTSGVAEEGCTGAQSPRINAGETWDMDSWGYCAPGAYGADVARVGLTVQFKDDEGRTGALSGFASTMER